MRIKKRNGAATRRQIIEPCNRGGLVTERIKVTIRTYFEVTEVGSGFGQCLVGKPDCESNEPVVPFLIGHRSPSASTPPRTKPREGDEQMPAGQERRSFAPRPVRVGPRLCNFASPFHRKIDRRNHL